MKMYPVLNSCLAMCFVTIKIELYGLTICSGQNKCYKLYTMLKWYVNSDNSQINETLWNIYLLDTLLCLQIPFTGKLKKNWKNGTFLILIILSNVLKMVVMWLLWIVMTFLCLKIGFARAKNQSWQDHFWLISILQNFAEELLDYFTQDMTLQTRILPLKKHIFYRGMMLGAYCNSKILHGKSNIEA